MNLKEQYAEHQKWYKEVYCALLHTPNRAESISFPQWLIMHGAQEPTDDDYITYYEDEL